MNRNDRRGNRNHGYRNDRNNRNDRNDRNDRSERNDRNDRNNRGNDRHSDGGRRFANPVSQKEIQEKETAIKAFKEKTTVCELCGQPITDVANAISNKNSDNPVHFDCVLNKLSENEKTGPNDRMTYIGQGRFAMLHFDNPHDMKHFTITKIIEWEERDKKRGSWRDEMAGLYSQVK